MKSPELDASILAREIAARQVMTSANSLSDALTAFATASDAVLAAIPGIAIKLGERAQARHSWQWGNDPPGNAVEAAQRVHAAAAAGRGTTATIEHQLCQAFSNGLARGSVAETVGYEFSTEAGPILRAAGEVAAQRARQTQPARQFVSIIKTQHQRLRAIVEQLKE
jgi:hypothetical protein